MARGGTGSVEIDECVGADGNGDMETVEVADGLVAVVDLVELRVDGVVVSCVRLVEFHEMLNENSEIQDSIDMETFGLFQYGLMEHAAADSVVVVELPVTEQAEVESHVVEHDSEAIDVPEVGAGQMVEHTPTSDAEHELEELADPVFSEAPVLPEGEGPSVAEGLTIVMQSSLSRLEGPSGGGYCGLVRD